jgi:ATP-dependent Lhr-like helicase
MDLDGLRELLGQIESGEVRTVSVETPMASAMSHEILSARPYAFVDDAPLEERRTRAVMMRRVTPDLEDGLGALDEEAIAEVRAQAWPDVRDPDELQDFLHSAGLVPKDEASAWQGFAEDLIAAGRAAHVVWQDEEGEERRGYAAVERIPMVRAGWESARTEMENIPIPPTLSGQEPPTKADSDRAFVRAWMECVGPITASQLAKRMGLDLSDVKIALAMLEGEGTVLQGRFTPDLPESEIEWCDRALLSRIHRLTLGRLRKEIEPVTASNFIRFLLRWQHVHLGTQLHGREGILEVIEQLQGLELPAPAWEAHVLPLRVKDYEPDDLEQLCLAGLVTWGRIEPGALLPSEEEVEAANGNGRRRRRAPTRVAPLALLLREAMPSLVRPGPTSEETKGSLSPAAQTVLEFLETRGASFLLDISNGTDRLKTEVEEALWELVARGLVTGDGIAGLRALLMTDEERKKKRRLRPIRGGRAQERFMPVGRWSLWRAEGAALLNKEERLEAFARQLLRRWGVVLRELAVRESHAFPWRELVGVFRRLEARGEIRGGRFVKGFVGEQFALPEAVEALRAVRRAKADNETAVVPSADPLNLVGVLTAGPRVSAYTRQVIRYHNGVPSDIDTLGAVRSRLENERIKNEGYRAEGE